MTECHQPRDTYHVHVLRTRDDGYILLSLVASLGKYAFRIQNAYQLIDCSKENGDAVVYTSGHGGG